MAGVLCTHGSTVFSQFPSLDLVLQILSHVLIPWLGFCALFHLDFCCHCFDLFKMFLIPVFADFVYRQWRFWSVGNELSHEQVVL